MILNHKSAIELLVEEAASIDYDRRTLFTLHAVLSRNLLSDAGGEGRLRTRAVGIGGSTYIPLAMPQQIEEYFTLILDKARAIPDAFERSFFAMVHVPYLQPFIDVNKRTSRMAANISLVKENLCPLSFIDVPSHSYVEAMLAIYEDQDIALLRDVYAWAYERSCNQYRIARESAGDPDIFRLRYGAQLAAAVRAMIAGMHAPARPTLRAWAESHQIPREDVARFADLALELILGLSEGAAARDRITAAEYAAWRQRFAKR
jgi:Fic family protein